MQRLLVFLTRVVPAALVWLILTDGAMSWEAWVIGAPAILASAALSLALVPAFEWSPLGAVKYAGFFVWESWRGGVDVARRAFHPRMPLAPGVIRHELDVEPELARVAVANSSSLLPGSLVIDLDEASLSLHALDAADGSPRRTVEATERRVADMFRLPAPAPAAPTAPAAPVKRGAPGRPGASATPAPTAPATPDAPTVNRGEPSA